MCKGCSCSAPGAARLVLRITGVPKGSKQALEQYLLDLPGVNQVHLHMPLFGHNGQVKLDYLPEKTTPEQITAVMESWEPWRW